MKRIYLDCAATTPMRREVRRAMKPWLGECFGNPSSLCFEGRRAKEAVEHARLQVSGLIGCLPSQLFFTSGATESNNALRITRIASGSHDVCISAVEHSSVRKVWPRARIFGVDERGKANLEELEAHLSQGHVNLVCLMLANNEVGTIQPVRECAEIVHKKYGVDLHVDATQAVGHIPVNVNDLGVDFLSFSAHKFGGPQGVGALYVRKPSIFSWFYGGGQEHGLRSGTENVAGIVGMGAAAECAAANLSSYTLLMPQKARILWDLIKEAYPAARLNGPELGSERLPGILNVWFPGLNGLELLMALDAAGVTCSAGSACSSGDGQPSRVLMAMYNDEARAESSLRFSMDLSTSLFDILRAGKRIKATIAKLTNRGEA